MEFEKAMRQQVDPRPLQHVNADSPRFRLSARSRGCAWQSDLQLVRQCDFCSVIFCGAHWAAHVSSPTFENLCNNWILYVMRASDRQSFSHRLISGLLSPLLVASSDYAWHVLKQCQNMFRSNIWSSPAWSSYPATARPRTSTSCRFALSA